MRKRIFDAVRQILGRGFTAAEIEILDDAIDEYDTKALKIEDFGGVPDLMVSQKAIDLIHSFESCKLTAYPDPGSKDGKPWTIGWGSTGPDIVRGTTWTQEQADRRFEQHLAQLCTNVKRVLGGAPTAQHQFDALVSFAYNLGVGEFSGSTLLKKHKAGDFGGAAAEFGKWVFNDGRKMNGLVRRRAAERTLYEGKV